MTAKDADQHLKFQRDLQQISVEVRFELSAVRAPIRELQALGEGYIFDLGSSPEKAVTITVGNEFLAEGEIVMVGDRIGVKVTRAPKP